MDFPDSQLLIFDTQSTYNKRLINRQYKEPLQRKDLQIVRNSGFSVHFGWQVGFLVMHLICM